ncbi:MAG: arginase [Bacteroidia bacterium]
MKTQLLVSASGLGAGKKGAELGPFALRIACENSDSTFFKDKKLVIEENDHRLYTSSNKYNYPYLQQILDFNELICNRSAEMLGSEDCEKLIVLAGDHSNAVGSISGLKKSNPSANIGVIWIDAHADLHSPYSTPSFNIHGMPLAALCCFDNKKIGDAEPVDDQVKFWKELKSIGGNEISPKIAPENLVFIGIRDLEEPEWRLIKKHNIKHFEPNHIEELGIESVISQTLEHLENVDVLYITFDVDSMDPSISEGTGTPVPNGLSKEEASKLLNAFYHHQKCKILEITEINPLLDTENKMAKAVVDVLKKAKIK